MKTSRRLKFTLLVPVLIFMSVMFMATHCVDYNPEMLFRLAGVIPEKVYNCVEDTCEITVQVETDIDLLNLLIKYGSEQGYELMDFEEIEDGTYQVTITLERGVNNITLRGEGWADFSELSFTIECVCPEEGAPELSWDPDKPPTDTTTEDTATLNIISDKELDALKVSINGQQQVTPNPEAEHDGDAFNYEATVELQDGENEIEVQGENESGLSNLIGWNIEKGQPPVIAFAEQPPSQVTNCVEEECHVTILISCDGGDEITHQVGDEEPITISTQQPDLDGNYPRGVILKKGINTITFTANNRFGTSNTLTCTIECICEETSSGYTKEQTIGETDIPKPIGLDFYPDTTQQKNFLNVLTKTAGDETQIMHGELTGGAFGNKYPNATLPANVGGYAFNGNDKTNLLLLPDQVKKLESDGQTLNSLHVFPEGQNGQVGQLKFQDVDTSYITKSITEIFYLNRNGAQVYSSNNKIVGLDIMRDAYKNTALYEKTAIGTVRQTGSDGRATEQSIITLADSGQVTELFDIPLSDGMMIDVITNVLDDDETVHFIVTTVKNETEYWVNIYSQSGERLYAFKTHDLNDLEQTSGETIFYQVVMASSWPDDKLYIIHSEFPGVQVWAPEE